MGYKKIVNLYKDTSILMFKECYALEKIHGTSAHVRWQVTDDVGKLSFFSGGEKHDRFVALFEDQALGSKFIELGYDDVTVFGEAYGGKQQGMSAIYGQELKFIAFEVKVGEAWLDVPDAYEVAGKLGFEFVYFEKGPATLEWVNEQRDMRSMQALRNGIEEPKLREGVVLRPIHETYTKNGVRIMSKHKRDEFMETKTPRKVAPEKLKIIADANAVAEEWVTDMRLRHVLDKLPEATDMKHTGMVIKAMYEDVRVEGEGEIVWSKAVKKAVCKKAALMYKKLVTQVRV